MDLKKRADDCFKSNDIRCLYGSELDSELTYRTGRAIVKYLNCKKIVVGYDMRYSSENLKKFLINGIMDQGADVIDIGMIDSPGLYFATGYFNLPGAIITASHNPIEYNGIKISGKKAVPISMDNGLLEIKELAIKNKFKKSNRGKYGKKNILEEYKKHIFSFVNMNNLSKVKVAIDAGNGIGGKIVPFVYKGLPFNIIKKHFKITGYFEDHVANPIKPENIKDLIEIVVNKKAELGIAFDSDMDRVVFVDENGRQIDSSMIACLIIKNYSRKYDKFNIVYSSIMSKIIPEITMKYKGKPYKEKVGHSYIKERMKLEKAVFGCEYSGHFFYKDNWYADSGIITSLIVLELYSLAKKEGITFSEMFKEFDKYFKIREKNFKLNDIDKSIRKIEKAYKNKARSISRFDGLTFQFDDYWFSVRKSNTEQLLRLNLEANSKEVMAKKTREIERFIEDMK